MDRLLFIVAQDRPDLYKYLTWHFSSEKEVQVIFNQRLKERRQRVEERYPERRRADRRRRAAVNSDPFSLNHVITRRIEEEVEPAVDRRQGGGQPAPHRLELNRKTFSRFEPILRDWSGRDDRVETTLGGPIIGGHRF